MQRASLRRVGVWVLGLAAAAPGCGDDGVIGASASASGTSTGSSSTGLATETGDDETGLMTGGPTQAPTTGEETGEPTSTTGAPDPSTTSGSSSSGEPGESSTGDGVNLPPVALFDRYITKAKLPLNVAAGQGLLANDSDVDGDPIEVVAADPLTPGGAQTMVQKDGSFQYLPPADLWGEDRFGYKIWDTVDGFAMGIARLGVVPTAIPSWAVAAGTKGFAIDGEAPTDGAGAAVHGVGDVDGDGFGDVVVGAYAAESGDGKAYVVFGRAAGKAVSLAKLEDEGAGFEIVGSAGEAAGTCVRGAGDVNGDGRADLVIGAPSASVNLANAGAVYVVFGKGDTGAVSLEAVGLGSGGFGILGAKASDLAGTGAHGAGDVNGDGRADVIVGAIGADPNGSFSGEAYVVFGRDQGKPTNLSDLQLGLGGGFVIRGEAMLDFAGAAVAGAGDVNGDGLADVVVGAYGSDIQGDASGRAYVVFGRTAVTPVELSDVTQGVGGFVADGEKSFDKAASAVAGAGDVNGDGLADVLIGSGRIDAVGEDSGRVYVVWGKQDTQPIDLAAVTQGDGGFAIDGGQVRDYAGVAIDGLGDVNGDGLDDVVVGAYGANAAGDLSGRAYVVYGRSETTKVWLGDVVEGDGGFALDGEAGADYSGFAVGAAGDVDGDGLADVIDGAFGSDAKGTDAGRSYVLFGGDYSFVVSAVGGSGPDNIVGTAGAEIFVGGRGNDTMQAKGGADILYTGAGDDTVKLDDVGFRRVDMGAGKDTVALTGAGLTLDLTQRPDGDLRGVEVFDLGDGGNALVLARRDLLALTPLSHALTVIGTQGSVEVDLGGSGFTSQGVIDGFKVYSDGITTLRIAEALMANVIL